MADGGTKRCLVALDAMDGPVLVEVELPAGASVAAALVQARRAVLHDHPRAAFDWDGAATGIWGRRCERTAVPQDGDRIELYRPLPADPRQRRRERAGTTGRVR